MSTTSAGIAPGSDGFHVWARVMESRDSRFDGRIFVAVTSTGIYCRPVCPAPTPRRRHVRFFAEAAAAEREGFRPCKRCRPGPRRDPLDHETAAELVERAVALSSSASSGAELARRLEVSTGRLRRALATELGATPDRVAHAARTGGPLSMALPYRTPFDADGLLAFLRDRVIAGVETVDGPTYRRSLSTSYGLALVSLGVDGERVRVGVRFEDARSLPAVVRAVRSLFDLRADPGAIARTLERDPALHPLVRAHPGIRLPGAADGFETAVRAIVGQQVSVPAARTVLGRIAARFGTPLDGPVPRLFPGPETLADAPLEELGVVGRRASAIRRIAAMVTRGKLELGASADPDETAARLLEVDGVGTWTAQYIRMRALGDPDAFVAGDLGVRRAFERLGLDATPAAIVERAEAWRPWRAYATMLLWRLDA